MSSTLPRALALPLLLLSLGLACGQAGLPSEATPERPGSGAEATPSPQVPSSSEETGSTRSPSEPPPASGEATGGACPALEGLPSQQGDLLAYLETASIAASRSEGFQEPRGPELVAFERTFERLLQGVDPEASAELAGLGFRLSSFRHEDGGAWLLLEDRPSRGGGTFVINLAPARDMWLEAPHADSDEGTLRQGAEQLVALGARALLITGAHRCASAAVTPCDGSSTVCGGKLRISDSAHSPHTFFTAAHRALRTAYPSGTAVSLHGMETQGAEAAIISDGTRRPRDTARSVRLRDALNQRLGTARRAFSCNAASDEGRFRPLCGTTNVQGRIDNGAADACFEAAPSATDRFLHVEQEASLRQPSGGSAVMEALAEVVPCSLSGSGLGCAPASPACR